MELPNNKMSNSYVEVLVKRKTSAVANAAKILLATIAVVAFLLGMVSSYVFILAGLIFGVIAYFVHLNIELEFEYLYLSKELTIDKIKAKSKRKRVIALDMQRLEIMAPESSHRLDSYKNRQMKTMDFSSHNADSKPYVIIYNGDEMVAKVIVEASDELIKSIEMGCPRKVFKD